MVSDETDNSIESHVEKRVVDLPYFFMVRDIGVVMAYSFRLGVDMQFISFVTV